jgi:hypothetical protein
LAADTWIDAANSSVCAVRSDIDPPDRDRFRRYRLRLSEQHGARRECEGVRRV